MIEIARKPAVVPYTLPIETTTNIKAPTEQPTMSEYTRHTEGKHMNEILLAIFAGLIVGLFFSAIKLPLPAPPVLPGIMGIVGVYLGGVAYQSIVERFFS